MKSFEDVFSELKGLFIDKDVSNIDNIAYQFRIIGEGAGVFYAEVKDHKLSIEPYNYNDHDAEFVGTYEVFSKIISGKLNPVKAFLTGKIKVNGDLGKASYIEKVLGGNK